MVLKLCEIGDALRNRGMVCEEKWNDNMKTEKAIERIIYCVILINNESRIEPMDKLNFKQTVDKLAKTNRVC